jgi:hypothetical protein
MAFSYLGQLYNITLSEDTEKQFFFKNFKHLKTYHHQPINVTTSGAQDYS